MNYHIDPIVFAVLTKVIAEFTPLVEECTCTPEVRKLCSVSDACLRFGMIPMQSV
ncbi:hypothetical protein Barb7_03050 [Bacteroidales bacterium Barb7]|nr:hypothetical protein Barb7_03050 [Bacteroidales bacterium Barb7]